jgi:hypothetical protein
MEMVQLIGTGIKESTKINMDTQPITLRLVSKGS